MKVIFYQAECGDATRIEYTGTDGKVHNIFFDMGFTRTYRHILQTEIKALSDADISIDACIISHIHDDHIGGAIAYLKAIQFGAITDIVKQWFYNPPRQPLQQEKKMLPEISSAASIGQGDELARYLMLVSKLPVDDFTNELSLVSIAGLTIALLSPDQSSLENLRNKYRAGKNNPFEREERVDISIAKSAMANDYHIPLDKFALNNTIEDTSIENGSSIAALIEHKGKKLLCLGDAFASVVVSSLKRLGYSNSNPLVCDWVKVSHHGSTGNNTMELYQMIRGNNFLISADGKNKYSLPAKQCISTILRSRTTSPETCHIYFTYDNAVLRSMFEIDGPDIFNNRNFMVHYLNEAANVFTLEDAG